MLKGELVDVHFDLAEAWQGSPPSGSWNHSEERKVSLWLRCWSRKGNTVVIFPSWQGAENGIVYVAAAMGPGEDRATVRPHPPEAADTHQIGKFTGKIAPDSSIAPALRPAGNWLKSRHREASLEQHNWHILFLGCGCRLGWVRHVEPHPHWDLPLQRYLVQLSAATSLPSRAMEFNAFIN